MVLPLFLHPPPLALPRSNLPFETRPPRHDSISVGLPSPATRFSARPPPEPLRDNLLRATTHRAYPTASIWSTLLHPSIPLSSPSGLDALAPPQCSAVPHSEPPKARRIPSTTARPAPSQLTSNSSAICVPNAAATLRSADCLPPGCVCWPRRNYIRTAFAVP